MMLADFVAIQRVAMNVKTGAAARYGADNGRGSDALDLFACRGECATAKALNLYWSGSIGDYKAVDVGGLVEVRSVNEPRRRLMVHKPDRDDFPFVLADTSKAPTVHLRGWMIGRDAKRAEWWRDPTGTGRHAFFVPLESLHDMAALIKRLKAAT